MGFTRKALALLLVLSFFMLSIPCGPVFADEGGGTPVINSDEPQTDSTVILAVARNGEEENDAAADTMPPPVDEGEGTPLMNSEEPQTDSIPLPDDGQDQEDNALLKPDFDIEDEPFLMQPLKECEDDLTPQNEGTLAGAPLWWTPQDSGEAVTAKRLFRSMADRANVAVYRADTDTFDTTVFTFGNIVVFSYYDETEINVTNNYGDVVYSGTLAADSYHSLSLSSGIYRLSGSKSYTVLVGDAMTNSCQGYYAVDQSGRGASTLLNTYMMRPAFASKYEHFIVFAYEDGTEFTIRNLDSGELLYAGTLGAGEHYTMPTTPYNTFLQVSANKSVSALSYTDQDYYVPSANGSFIGTLFYGYSGYVGTWTNSITVTAYYDNTTVTVINTETGEEISSYTLNAGQVHSDPVTAEVYWKVQASEPVTAANIPYCGYSGSYYYMTRAIDQNGIGTGTLFYIPTISSRIDVFSHADENNITITQLGSKDDYPYQNPTQVYSGQLNIGEVYTFTSALGEWVYKVESSDNVSVLQSNGGAGADFMPLNYALELPDLSVSSSDIQFTPEVGSCVPGDPVTANITIHNRGALDACDVTVEVYDGDPDKGVAPVIASKVIDVVTAGGSAELSCPILVPAEPEYRSITVKIDPRDEIVESNNSNNKAIKPWIPNQDLMPPLAVNVTAPSGLNLINGKIDPNPFTVTADVFNTGTGAAYNVKAELLLMDGLTLNSGELVNELSSLEVGQHMELGWQVNADMNTSGYKRYQIMVGAENAEAKSVKRVVNVPDPTPPSPPTGLSAVANEGGGVNLTWNQNAEPDLSGYKIFYGLDSTDLNGSRAEQGASPLIIPAVASYTITGLVPDTPYYFGLKAVDWSGNESDLSAIVSCTPSSSGITLDLTRPGQDARYTAGSVIALEAAATGMDQVKFFVSRPVSGYNFEAIVTGSGVFRTTWDSKRMPAGTYVVGVQDTLTGSIIDQVTITLRSATHRDETPVVNISKPDDGDIIVSGKLTVIEAFASSDQNILSTDLYIDGRLQAEMPSASLYYEWDTSEAAAGQHTLKVEATDYAGNTGSQSITVQIAEKKAVELTAPEDDAAYSIGDRIVLSAVGTKIDFVKFYVKNISTGWYANPGQNLSGEYVTTWDTSGLAAGKYLIRVIGYSNKYEELCDDRAIITLGLPSVPIILEAKAVPPQGCAGDTFTFEVQAKNNPDNLYLQFKMPGGTWLDQDYCREHFSFDVSRKIDNGDGSSTYQMQKVINSAGTALEKYQRFFRVWSANKMGSNNDKTVYYFVVQPQDKTPQVFDVQVEPPQGYAGDTFKISAQVKNSPTYVGILFDNPGNGWLADYFPMEREPVTKQEGSYTYSFTKPIYSPGVVNGQQRLFKIRASNEVGKDLSSENITHYFVVSPWVTMKYGDTGSEVSNLQKRMIKLGMDVGSTGADGIFGKKTLSATVALQINAGNLTIDGKAGNQTGTAINLFLNGDSNTANLVNTQNEIINSQQNTMAYNSRGNGVKYLQALLNGYLKLDVGGVDGIYGDKTAAAVKAIQRYTGYPILDSLQPQLWPEIYKLLNCSDAVKKILAQYQMEYLIRINCLAKPVSNGTVTLRTESITTLVLEQMSRGKWTRIDNPQNIRWASDNPAVVQCLDNDGGIFNKTAGSAIVKAIYQGREIPINIIVKNSLTWDVPVDYPEIGDAVSIEFSSAAVTDFYQLGKMVAAAYGNRLGEDQQMRIPDLKIVVRDKNGNIVDGPVAEQALDNFSLEQFARSSSGNWDSVLQGSPGTMFDTYNPEGDLLTRYKDVYKDLLNTVTFNEHGFGVRKYQCAISEIMNSEAMKTGTKARAIADFNGLREPLDNSRELLEISWLKAVSESQLDWSDVFKTNKDAKYYLNVTTARMQEKLGGWVSGPNKLLKGSLSVLDWGSFSVEEVMKLMVIIDANEQLLLALDELAARSNDADFKTAVQNTKISYYNNLGPILTEISLDISAKSVDSLVDTALGRWLWPKLTLDLAMYFTGINDDIEFGTCGVYLSRIERMCLNEYEDSRYDFDSNRDFEKIKGLSRLMLSIREQEGECIVNLYEKVWSKYRDIPAYEIQYWNNYMSTIRQYMANFEKIPAVN